MYKMKQDLKNLAADIKNGKSGRKPKNRNDMNAKDYQNLYYARRQFRHLHIAHCLMHGRTMEQIENPREGNEPSQAQIDKYIANYPAYVPRVEVEQQEAA
jgi:hypothetical protein